MVISQEYAAIPVANRRMRTFVARLFWFLCRRLAWC
jgi:hypothetical protein